MLTRNNINEINVDPRFLAVLEVSNILSMSLSLEDILQKSVDLIVAKLDLLSAVIYINYPTLRKIGSKTFTNKAINQAITKMINKSFDSLYISYEVTDNLVVKTVLEKKEFIDKDLSKFITPVVSDRIAKSLQLLSGTNVILSIPILYHNDCLGAIMFTRGGGNESNFEDILSLLRIYSQQLSIAIYNAQLFQQVNNQIAVLKKQNEDITSLYTLASNVSKSLDPVKVAQAAVNSLPQDKIMIGAMISRIYTDKNYIAPLAASDNQLAYAAKKLIGDFEQYGLNISDPAVQNNLIIRTIKTEQPIFSNNISEFLEPALKGKLLDSLAKLLNVKSVAVYPLIIRDRVIGATTFFLRDKSAEELDTSQKQLFQTYANQIAIALENAQLFLQAEEIQRKLEQSLKELEAARKYERDMIDIMGHELRTPMSIVRNALLMMESQMKTDDPSNVEKIRKYVDIGVESARREVSLIETLLSATKTDGKGFQLLFEKIDLNDVIKNSLLAFKREAERKGIELLYEAPEKQIAVYTDRTRIQEVADNFINNAVKYTMKGSVVVKVFEQDGFGYVSVKDTGIGISQEDVKRLGTKFFRARQYIDTGKEKLSPEKLEVVRPGGTGLGLYVTFNLIKIMDGKLSLQSRLGEGSTFVFGMPLYTGQDPKQIERKPDADEFQA